MLGDPKGERTVLTDSSGEFEFKEVSAPTSTGSVVLGAKKPEFLCKQNGPREQSCVQSVDILSREVRVTLKLMPQAVITGSVRNQAGEPIRGLTVSHLERRIGPNAQYEWQRLPEVKTNEEGAYRIAGIEPGSYLLRTADAVDPDAAHPTENLTATNVDHGYAATYYPDTADVEAAKPIAISAGETVAANFTLKNRKFQLVTIFYSANEPGTGLPGYGLSSLGNPNDLTLELDTKQRAFHLFAPPGTYTLETMFWPPSDPKTGNPLPWKNGTTRPFYGSTEFTVKDAPVTIPDIPAQQAIAIPIHVQTVFTQQELLKASTGQSDYYYAPRGALQLNGGVDLDFSIGWDQQHSEKELQFKDVPPGKYAASGYGNDGVYAASITCGSLDLLREQLIVGPGEPPCTIEALLRDDSATLDVGLTPDANKNMETAGITVTTVYLIPLDKPRQRAGTEFVFKTPDPRRLKGVAPGQYLIVLTSNPSSQAYRDTEVQKKLMAEGSVISLAAGEHRTILLGWAQGQ